MRRAGHVARKGEGKSVYLREREHLEDPGVDVRIILRWVFRKRDKGAWTGMIRLRRAMTDTCECSNETSGSINCGEFLD